MNDPLDRLLRECCLQIRGTEKGTGFFVQPDLVLTCAHVVGRDRQKGDRTTLITRADGAQKTAELAFIFPEEDLALLKVEAAGDQYVILGDEVRPDDRFLLIGFPVYVRQIGPECDSLKVWEDGETVAANGDHLVKFRGNLVIGGFSGGPALNLRTGEVIGVVKARRDNSGNPVPVGGWAVPTKTVKTKCAELTQLKASFAEQRKLWQAALEERTKLIKGPPKATQASLQRIDYLPYYGTNFTGREREINDCIETLREVRWLTLTGMGGVGKTRLAVEIARQLKEGFPDGGLFVDLAAAGNSEQAVLSTLAARLKEQELEIAADDQQSVLTALKNRRMLLLLDNFENVFAGAQLPAKLLRQCRYLRLLVTSQRSLGLSPEGEHERRVQPLETPDINSTVTRDQLRPLDSFALFRNRVKAVEPDWEINDANAAAVAAIINLTEGIPLSIELAAAHAGDATLEEIRNGIRDARSEFLARAGASLDERHTSIRACIDWTFKLLSPDAQVLLSRLAIFAGGFFAADVKTVCRMENASDLLVQLRNYSLISREERLGQSRYRMLGTICDYAASKLGPEKELLERKHAEHFLAVLKSASQQFKSREYLAAAARIDADLDNIYAGIGISVKVGAHLAVIDYAALLSDYLRVRGRFAERLALAEQAHSAAEALNISKMVASCDADLGAAYIDLPGGDRAANLQKAIECCEAALRVYSERDFPQDWARTQNNLSNAYYSLPGGNRAANLQKAIECCEAALRVRTERDFPQDWALTQISLGNAFSALPGGNRAANLQKAIECCEAALRVYTERDFPQGWALTQNNLGNAYYALPGGDRAANLQKAIECCEATQRVYTERDFPQAWARTQINLGSAYSDLPGGQPPATDLRKAIECYEAALRIYTERDFPEAWALTQNNLGTAYLFTAFFSPPGDDRAANLQNAIECCEAALRVRTERDFPQDWAITQNNLGNAYCNLSSGEPATNLRKGINCYEAALRVCTERDFPRDWAMIQNNLGQASGDLRSGDRATNLQKAIECYEAALRVYTERDFFEDWARIQNKLDVLRHMLESL